MAYVGHVCYTKLYMCKYYILLQKQVYNYAVMIAEEDGDVDMDLPRKDQKNIRVHVCVCASIIPTYMYAALERDDHIAKFRFKHLGIVEVRGYTVICLFHKCR